MHTLSVYGAACFKHVPVIGDSIVNSMNNCFRKHCQDMHGLSKEFTFAKPVSMATTYENDSLVGKTFVITGSLQHFEDSDAAKTEIELHGEKVSGSVSAKTSYLVNNGIESPSGKNKKAKVLGIPSIFENPWVAMMRSSTIYSNKTRLSMCRGRLLRGRTHNCDTGIHNDSRVSNVL